MTAETPKPEELSLAGRWISFLQLRHSAEDLIKKMELTDSSLTFGIHDERAFRNALRELEKVLDQMKTMFGPETKVNPSCPVM